MSIIKKEFRYNMVETRAYCDKCGEEVKYNKISSLENPITYEHICKCGESYWLDNIYPTLQLEKKRRIR